MITFEELCPDTVEFLIHHMQNSIPKKERNQSESEEVTLLEECSVFKHKDGTINITPPIGNYMGFASSRSNRLMRYDHYVIKHDKSDSVDIYHFKNMVNWIINQNSEFNISISKDELGKLNGDIPN